MIEWDIRRYMPAPKKVTDEELLTILDRSDSWVLSTSEIAQEVSISRQAVLNRLDDLHKEGRIQKKQVGERNIVWHPNWDYWKEA